MAARSLLHLPSPLQGDAAWHQGEHRQRRCPPTVDLPGADARFVDTTRENAGETLVSAGDADGDALVGGTNDSSFEFGNGAAWLVLAALLS